MADFDEWAPRLGLLLSGLLFAYLSGFLSLAVSVISKVVYLSIVCLLLVLVLILLRTSGFEQRIPWFPGVFDSISENLSNYIIGKASAASKEMADFGDWAPRLGLLLSGLLFGCLSYFFSLAVAAGLTAAAMGGVISQSPASVTGPISKYLKDLLSGASKVVRNHWGKLSAALGAMFSALKHCDLIRRVINYLKLIYEYRYLIFWACVLVVLVLMYLQYLSVRYCFGSWISWLLLPGLILVYVNLDRLRTWINL